ncbi:MAG: VWA domain-containing protein [Acidobacteriota bacterium]|nr:VWA domain-containing protein [Acidobacteriota bacterium]
MSNQNLRLGFCLNLILDLILVTGASVHSQQKSRQPLPVPTPPNMQEEPVKVFTEEVRLPVVAVDQFGHYDPSVVPDDILVLEDGVSQQIKSVRHIPANVVLMLDTGGELSGLGGFSKRTSLTREVAIALLNQLSEGTWVATMQFNNSVELLQNWTRDRPATLKVLKTKLLAGKRARFADAIVAAAEQLKDRPEGSRHVVFITDGVDTPGGKIDRAQAIKQLAATRATVHIISYTEFVRQKDTKANPRVETGQLPTSHDPITSNDPTQPPGTTRSPTFGVTVRFDPAMRRQRKAYEAEIKKSQQILTGMAEETGGQIFLPKTSEQMIAQARGAAREIGAEYVVTYRPRRPLADAKRAEYRRIEVASRRVGLSLRSRRGYVVPSQAEEK